MFVNHNGVVRSMGHGLYPMPLYFFMSADRKITPEQLKANLRRIVERYVTVAVNENKKKTGGEHKEAGVLRTEVSGAVNNAIKELLDEIKIDNVSISTTSSGSSASKLFNLGSYVQDMNAELNQMINDGIPL
jgi:hypothetical protein